MSGHRFKVGDVACVARYDIEEEQVPCPVCFGKLAVVVILGNGDRIETPCDYCGKGFQGPRGVVGEYCVRGRVEMLTIDAVESSETACGVQVEYRSGPWILCESNTFATRDEAEARAAELEAEHKRKQETRVEYIKKEVHKSFSWNVGYHMRVAKGLREQSEYHENKARLCKERLKGGGQ